MDQPGDESLSTFTIKFVVTSGVFQTYGEKCSHFQTQAHQIKDAANRHELGIAGFSVNFESKIKRIAIRLKNGFKKFGAGTSMQTMFIEDFNILIPKTIPVFWSKIRHVFSWQIIHNNIYKCNLPSTTKLPAFLEEKFRILVYTLYIRLFATLELKRNRDSALWISLEEAVERTGTSRKNILQWVSEGLIKKEKHKGRVYLWVADLSRQIPLQILDESATPEKINKEDKQLLLSPEGDILPGEIVSPLKQFAGQLEESLKVQQKISEQLEVVNDTLAHAPQNHSPLDEKTVKELSLLGSVFRSIHQQNEKSNEALEKHHLMLENLSTQLASENSSREKLEKAEKKIFRTGITSIAALALVTGIGFLLLYFLYQDNQQKENDLKIAHKQKLENEILFEKNLHRLQEEKQARLNELRDAHNEKLLALTLKKEKELDTLNQKYQNDLHKSQKFSQALMETFQENTRKLHEKLKQAESEIHQLNQLKASTDSGSLSGALKP